MLVLITIAVFGQWELQDGEQFLAPARFTDNGDGTVTDNRTGWIWMKDANCFGALDWYQTTMAAANLADGQCGLTDGSSPGDWRLPGKVELQTLLDERYEQPALSNTAGTGPWIEGDPFFAVQSKPYWSASTHKSYPDVMWFVSFSQGYMLYYSNESFARKTATCYVWLVRDGQ
jgi:hypothetical protein